jgi:exodeoxyribonuclease VII large subunit
MEPQNVSDINQNIDEALRTLGSENGSQKYVAELQLYPSKGPHCYGNLLDINDPKQRIRCCFFGYKNKFPRLLTDYSTGDNVLVQGYINLYQSSVSLIVTKINKNGDVKGKYTLLKENTKLLAERKGYFAKEKRMINISSVQKIALLTSYDGDVKYDIINHIKYFTGIIEIHHVNVQGDKCPSTNIDTIRRINVSNNADVIILARGGGSESDLSGYDNLALLRSVYKSKIPIITSIGHTNDTPLVANVADMDFPTPTAIGEFINKYYVSMLMSHMENINKMDNDFRNYIRDKKNKHMIKHDIINHIIDEAQQGIREIDNTMLQLNKYRPANIYSDGKLVTTSNIPHKITLFIDGNEIVCNVDILSCSPIKTVDEILMKSIKDKYEWSSLSDCDGVLSCDDTLLYKKYEHMIKPFIEIIQTLNEEKQSDNTLDMISFRNETYNKECHVISTIIPDGVTMTDKIFDSDIEFSKYCGIKYAMDRQKYEIQKTVHPKVVYQNKNITHEFMKKMIY